MNILALDIATKCGFAYGELETLQTGTWNLTPRRDESKGMRLIRLQAKLNELREYGVGLLVFEAVRAAGGHLNAAIVQAEIQGVVKAWAETAGIEYRGYSSSEIKRFATGKGNAKKQDMIHAAIHKFGREVSDDNEADALALWHLAWSEYGDTDFPQAAAGEAKPLNKPATKQGKENADH